MRVRLRRRSYRDSKLTRLLKDSLGGNTRTVMIVTMSPSQARPALPRSWAVFKSPSHIRTTFSACSNHQRRLTLWRPTAAPTATSCAYFLTLQFLWQVYLEETRNSLKCAALSLAHWLPRVAQFSLSEPCAAAQDLPGFARLPEFAQGYRGCTPCQKMHRARPGAHRHEVQAKVSGAASSDPRGLGAINSARSCRVRQNQLP